MASFLLRCTIKPAGGVTQGQKLTVPFTAGATGAWKDDICACTRYGICHPSFINALCCPLILLGQVMTRFQLDWLARPAAESQFKKTFAITVCITIAYAILQIVLSPSDPDQDTPGVLYNMVSLTYGIFMLLLVTKMRRIVREQYAIPETRCGGMEDFCCAFWCGCCTISQLARQTTDYDIKDGRFFTNDGLPPNIEAPIVTV